MQRGAAMATQRNKLICTAGLAPRENSIAVPANPEDESVASTPPTLYYHHSTLNLQAAKSWIATLSVPFLSIRALHRQPWLKTASLYRHSRKRQLRRLRTSVPSSPITK